ncbi:MAG: hypothetical protein J0L64_27140, partial [Acidobacteria bacterium]|nr:hypothetical protein [Acidobacteriota bacterium]
EAFGKEVLQSMLYEGHPYGHPELGTEASLARIGVDDVRAHRAEFRLRVSKRLGRNRITSSRGDHAA